MIAVFLYEHYIQDNKYIYEFIDVKTHNTYILSTTFQQEKNNKLEKILNNYAEQKDIYILYDDYLKEIVHNHKIIKNLY